MSTTTAAPRRRSENRSSRSVRQHRCHERSVAPMPRNPQQHYDEAARVLRVASDNLYFARCSLVAAGGGTNGETEAIDLLREEIIKHEKHVSGLIAPQKQPL